METYRWEQAAERWLEEKQDKADFRGDKAKLDWLAAHLNGKALEEIDRETVRQIVEVKETGATRNRYVALIRAILRAAALQWKWSKSVPVLLTYKEPKRRIRYLKREQVDRLVELLGELPAHQKDMFLFALATGLRQGNVKRMQWDWIDLDERVAYLPEEEMKGSELAVPLNDLAVSILERWAGAHPRHVFVYHGKPLQNVNTRAWQRVRREAGLHQFRWHCATRHTWASWLAQNGVNALELQELGGWKSPEMVRRYAALAPDHLRKHVAVIDGVLDGRS